MTKHKDKLKIQIVPITDYANDKILDSISLAKLDSDVVLLPNNKILKEIKENENQFTPITKEILLTLREKGIKADLYDDGKDKHEIVLRSAHTDIILPALIFADKYLIPIVLGIISTWIYNKWIKSKKESQPIEIEYGYIDSQKAIIKQWKFKGPAEKVKEIIDDELINFDENMNDFKPNLQDNNGKKESKEDICKNRAKKSMKMARQLTDDAKKAIYAKNMKEAESLLRKSLVKIREAYSLTRNPLYQDKLYTVGRKIHDIFGCQLEFEDGQYKQSCPVILSNYKRGFSIGGSSTTMCSVCGKNILDCSHVNGETYDNVLAQNLTDICNICREKDCDHELGKYYDNVKAFGIITKMDLDHVALVENPADPLCVILSNSVPKSKILNELPENERDKFVYGKTIVYCHHCILKKSIM
ncbi:MAG: hypothetical protein ABFC34_06610 [Methanobacterium sp.]